jgi:hypothetical protein
MTPSTVFNYDCLKSKVTFAWGVKLHRSVWDRKLLVYAALTSQLNWDVRKSWNKHLRFSISHVSFIPSLVVKIYAPCICYARTFPVQLVMIPVHTFHDFVHPIYSWKQIHTWIQIFSEWNEATLDGSRCLSLMYGQALGWSYVITPGMQRQCWQQALECRNVQERILIPCCICSWHVQDLRILTQITLPRPESHDNYSQMKTYFSDLIWGRRKDRHHRRWGDQYWLNTPCIRAGFIANITQQSFPIGMSSSNHNSCVEERMYWCDSTVSCKVSRSLRYFTDTWNIHQQDKMTSSSETCIHYSSNG